MKKVVGLLLCGVLAVSAAACSPKKEVKTLTGTGKGFGGEITVTVTTEDGKITKVEAVGEKETQGIGSNAIKQLPAKIVEAGNTDVDTIAGATVSSKGILYAVNNALDPETYPWPIEESKKDVNEVVASDADMGFGVASSGRVGPGKDDQEVQVYSFNQVYASAIFDKEGKILELHIDQLEVATPNYDGETMPHFSGYPGQTGYNIDENHDGKVDGVTENTEDLFMSEIDGWKTKRERGEGYVMGTGYWYQQMDKYESIFVGMSVDEVEEWFAKYCSDLNGRPLQANASKDEDVKKYEALSQEEKDMLADVTSSATMSLQDGHGDILKAIKKAYENRRPLTIEGAKGLGFGVANSGRVGPGKDDQEVQVYSFNDVFVTTLFDENDKIAALMIDQLEVATPNYDGETMPHFSGYPGQSYNIDENHDGKVDGVTENTEDLFMSEIDGWKTKRERGEGYVMGTGYWYQQMDKYESIFVGMSVDEVEEWFAKYCSDLNGRPLQANASKDEDVKKYEALSQEEKDMLADVTSSATMSLQDGHGDILKAIRKSLENKHAIDLKIGQ